MDDTDGLVLSMCRETKVEDGPKTTLDGRGGCHLLDI